MATRCDVIVLGMGTCGEDAALRLAAAGLDVVGIEERLIGGECPFWACLPTKSMVRSANLVAEARRADGLVGRVTVEPDWQVIARRLRAEITGDWTDAGGVSRFEAKGGRFIRGRGVVVGPRTVQVGDQTVTASRGILVSTGSTPVIPPIDGLATVPYWTNHEAIATEVLPESIAILGGGVVGCELGQVFARFGASVTIIEGASRLLPAEEPEASALVAEAMEADGVKVVTGARATSVEGDESLVRIRLADGSAITTSRLLVAVGRSADADSIGVGAAGATTRAGFVEVDGRLRAADGLWAIGDVTGQGMLTSVAEYQGRIAVEDILGGEPTAAGYEAIPRAIFTDPEVGAVGLTEAQARTDGHDVATVVKNLGSTFRGWIHGTGNSGVIKLVADRSENRLVGATVVGPSASEVLGFLALAVDKRIEIDELVDSIYAFPSFYGGIGEAIGAYGRGIVRVLDPDTAPLVGDPNVSVGPGG